MTSCFSVQVIWISWAGSVLSYETRTPKVYIPPLFHFSTFHCHFITTRTRRLGQPRPRRTRFYYISKTNRRSRERAVSSRAVARSAGVGRRAARAAPAPPRPSRLALLLASLCCNPFDGPLPIRSGRVAARRRYPASLAICARDLTR